jgi:hypothetical protein
MSDEKKEPRLLIKEGLFPDVLKLLSDGVCLGMSAPPRPGAFVFTVAMDVQETEKDARLIAQSAAHIVLSDGSARPGHDFEMGVCQTCTLHLTIDAGVQIGDPKGVGVKVHLDKKGAGCSGWPTIVIR